MAFGIRRLRFAVDVNPETASTLQITRAKRKHTICNLFVKADECSGCDISGRSATRQLTQFGTVIKSKLPGAWVRYR